MDGQSFIENGGRNGFILFRPYLQTGDFDFHGGNVLGEEVNLSITLRNHLLKFGERLFGDEVSLERDFLGFQICEGGGARDRRPT